MDIPGKRSLQEKDGRSGEKADGLFGKNKSLTNYDRMQEDARRLFLTLDFDAGCRRVGLCPTGDGVSLRAFGESCLVRRLDGEVLDGSGKRAAFGYAMSVYDVLGRTGDTPRLSGNFVPTSALHGIMGSNSVHEDLGKNSGAYFDGRSDALREACTRRGGTPGTKGDVSFVLPVFDFFPVELRFWEADDEFPALLQWFWDANALQFAHYETLWYMSGQLLERLRAETDVIFDQNRERNP